jgi:alpha/beta superfamily hydrolase
MSPPSPRLDITGPAADARAVVLLLHGGEERSLIRSRRGLAYARMVPFAWAIARASQGRRVAVWLLRYRYRGWNEPDRHPVQDARWALDEARRRHPGAPIVLVAHSMGGRVALRVADDPDVVGICALAPWIEDDEPVTRPAGARVFIAHGDRDRTTEPANSLAYAARIGATFLSVPGDGHPMLRRWPTWTALVVGFVRDVLGLQTPRISRPDRPQPGQAA